jgi:ribosomal protein S12 methylthiotransferase
MSRSRPRRPLSLREAEPSVCLVSLGCSKNLVDTEVMAGHLAREGLALHGGDGDADVVIVNTCGFIGDARAESEAVIGRYAAAKRAGRLRGLVVTGCMVELHESRLARQFPEVDALLPISDYSGVPSIVRQVLGGAPSDVCPTGEAPAGARGASGSGPGYATVARPLAGGLVKQRDSDLGRALLTAPHTAYLRLGEGCNHVCAFCAIPKIRGRLKSKPLEVLVEEAAALAQVGARELTLIAEDSTDWGKDLGTGQGLHDLLPALGAVEGLRWIRVMYAHPATLDDRLIAAMAGTPHVARYLDMPVQHGDEHVLKLMRRGTTPARIRQAVARLRAAIPDIALRTTILVGFPGETEDAFARLMDLLEELRFDRVGCFVFSPEQDTEAARLPGAVPPEVAGERRERVMDVQRRLLLRANRARVGTHEEVLVDAAGDARAVARSERDAPEIDGRVLLEGPGAGRLRAGDFVRVKVTGAKGYDLVALPDRRPRAG